jgi:hypothetical protein
MTGQIRPEFRIHPQTGASGAGTSAAMKGLSTKPAQLTRNDSGTFQSPASPILPVRAQGSVAYRYGILGNSTRRLRSQSSMGDAGSPDHPSGLARCSSLSDLSPEATQHVKINGQEYFTTKEPLFEDGSFLLVKIGDTSADALLGRPLPNGTWNTHPARNIGFKHVVLYGQKYEVSPWPSFDTGTYKLYPMSPSNFIQANDVVEAVITPEGQWKIVVPSQNKMPPSASSSSATPSTRSATPSSMRSGTPSSLRSGSLSFFGSSTQSSTAASTTTSSREGSQSREPAPAATSGDGANASFFSKLWQRLKNIF